MIALRDYQSAAIERVRVAMRAGHRRVLLVSPTGSGKSTIGSAFAVIANGQRQPVLWLAPRTELVDQAAETLTRMGLQVGAVCASSAKPPNPYAPVQVASVQTLLARNLRPRASMIVVDECHHSVADEQAALLASYNRALVIGLTATPERGDGRPMGDAYDHLVVAASVRELTDVGHLVPCEILRPDRVLGPGEIAQSPVAAYLEHARGRRALVFARSVQLADQYRDEFRGAGLRALSLSDKTPWAERRRTIDALRRGGVDVVTNVMVATEGLDAPEVDCVLIARGCGSASLYLQIIGRGLRPAPGKTDCLLLDLRGVSHDHGRPDDERVYSLDGRGISLKDPNSYCAQCGAPRTPPDPCERCGFAPARDEAVKVDTVTGDKLSKFAKLRETDDEGKRAERLGRWLREAYAAGHKPGRAMHRYRAVYEAFPTPTIRRAAEAIAREKSA